MKIYQILTIAGLLFITATAFSQQTTLKGNIKGLGDAELIFLYYEGSDAKTSKVKVVGDKFTWTAAMADPQKITIIFPKRTVWLFVEPGNMELTGSMDSLNKAKLTGSKIQEEANSYGKLLEPFLAREQSLSQKYKKASKEEQLAIKQEFQTIRTQKWVIANKYIDEHPESAFSLSLVTDRAIMGDYNDIQKTYDMLGKGVKNTPEGKRLTEHLALMKRSAIGTQMVNFTQNDAEGRPVSFAAFKGKYVFIDFWASWCGPCRQENPNVLKAYNKYKDKNFTVLGISLDDDVEKWKKAIEEDGLPWTQLSDLKGSKNEVAQYFGIKAIPSTLLVGPQGKIIAKDLRGEMLNKKLEEIFNEQSN